MKELDTTFLENKVLTYCERYGMLKAGDCVVVGVSGGADSVCLLFLLCAFRAKIPFSMRVVHVHHGIRPEAGQDAAYVGTLCKELGLPFLQVNADVPELARREGLSLEEAGRKVRYQAFFDAASDWQRTAAVESAEIGGRIRIALAHHMGDRAETLLFHLFRGSGLRGLGSIQPLRKAQEGYEIIRPLLCLERAQIEDYLDRKGISYCQDNTNFEDEYARNRLRHHILPYAEKEICRGAVRHLNEAAELLSETEEYMELQTIDAYRNCVTESVGRSNAGSGAEIVGRPDAGSSGRSDTGLGAEIAGRPDAGSETESGSADREIRIQVEEFRKLHPLMQKRILVRALCEMSPGRKDIGAVHVRAVLDLFQGASGRSINLPFGISAGREYGEVWIKRCIPNPEKGVLSEEEIPLEALSHGEDLSCQWGGNLFEFRVFDLKKSEIIPENTYTKWFDYDKIKSALFLRSRKSGDYFMLRGAGKERIRKTIKDYFITEKIPRDKREQLPLLAEGDHVLWIAGYRISEAYKVSPETKRILQVHMEKAACGNCKGGKGNG